MIKNNTLKINYIVILKISHIVILKISRIVLVSSVRNCQRSWIIEYSMVKTYKLNGDRYYIITSLSINLIQQQPISIRLLFNKVAVNNVPDAEACNNVISIST